QHTDEVESEEKDESPGHRGEKRAVPEKERADGAGGCAKRNKNNREAGDKRESRSKQAGAGNLALAELLHADRGEHGDVAGNKSCERAKTRQMTDLTGVEQELTASDCL